MKKLLSVSILMISQFLISQPGMPLAEFKQIEQKTYGEVEHVYKEIKQARKNGQLLVTEREFMQLSDEAIKKEIVYEIFFNQDKLQAIDLWLIRERLKGLNQKNHFWYQYLKRADDFTVEKYYREIEGKIISLNIGKP